MIRKWFDKKVLILGLSKSGIAAAKHLNSKGAECFITEKKPLKEEDVQTVKELNDLGIKTEFEHHSDEFMQDVYIAVTSPGIPPQSELILKLKEKNINVISEVELAYLETQVPFLAITGTNGKTTTTELTNFILNKEFRSEKCGNIGIPPCSLLEKETQNKTDFYVCEISSFQLHYSPGFRPQIAVWMNFTPDHIDWHGGLENYFKDKASLFASSKKPGFAVFNAQDKRLLKFGEDYTGEKFFFGQEFETNCCYIKDNSIYFKRKPEKEVKIIDLKDVPLVGNHNYQNVMASIICAEIAGVPDDKITQAIKEFEAPEHRCEFVGNILGKAVYNDSKATNPEAAIVAIKSFEGKSVTLIAGGTDKNTDLTEFCRAVKEHINHVILLGLAKDRFEAELRKNGYENITIAESFKDGADKAFEKTDEVILLSPACSSYDMFSGYEERGRVFKEYALSKK